MAGLSVPATAGNLHYQLHPADLACPTATRFAEEVTAKLGFSPWGDGPGVRITIEAAGGQYTGRLVSGGDRERTFRAATCRRVTDLLVTATAIALDRREPVRPAAANRSGPLYTTPIRVATDTSPPPRADEIVLPANPAVEWAFAGRNNHFQLGIGIDSIVGSAIASGAVPLSRGHFDLGLGHASDSYVGMSRWSVQALYMWPVFYINKNSSFEVPIYAGGGAAYAWSSVTDNGTMDTSDSQLIPELAVSQSLQFRKFPVEFMLAMTFALAEPLYGGSRLGVNAGLRYVFRGH
jgi:hypothetical protein